MSTDHFSGHAADYARHRPGYPPELFAWLSAQCSRHDLAWDCGTGNGQAARGLAEHFRHVVATDLSAEQVGRAESHPRIDYRAAPAETSGLESGSVDLVVVAQALHWFCHEDFYAEVRRVLHRQGMLAAWTYTLLKVAAELDTRIARFHDQTLAPYWPPERRWVNAGYVGMPFPFAEFAAPAFAIHLQWTLDELIAYLRTWSATQRCLQDTGIDPTLALADELAPLWGDPATRRAVVWPLALRCGRLS